MLARSIVVSPLRYVSDYGTHDFVSFADISPHTDGIIFVTIDVAALIVQVRSGLTFSFTRLKPADETSIQQAIGGGMAASAAENISPSGPSQAARGGHIMLGMSLLCSPSGLCY